MEFVAPPESDTYWKLRMPEKILVIEDTADIARMIRAALEESGFQTSHARNGIEGLDTLRSNRFDLVILDLNMPGMDGLAVCRALRSQGNDIPIIMLTSRNSEHDIVLGLELGADDYLTKPFSLPELTARIRSLLRRIDSPRSLQPASPQTLIRVGDLIIDLEKRHVLRDGEKIMLTAKEFELLVLLARHPGRVFTRDQLLNDVWGYSNSCYEHTVNSHVNRLRSKIEPDPASPVYILTAWGVGYRFCEAADLPAHTEKMPL
jgi:DNA-binding response OmpR family regulator